MKEYFKKSKSFLALVLAVMMAFTMMPVQSIQAATPVAKITWKATKAIMETTNNGTVSGTYTATLANDTFKQTVGKALTKDTHYTIAGLPAGMTATLKQTSTKVVTVTFAGKVTKNKPADAALASKTVITFKAAAFKAGKVPTTTNGGSYKTFTVKFMPEITWSGTISETATNDGTVASTYKATIVGDKFKVKGGTMPATSYTLTNKPAGLTAKITTNTAGTIATLTFTGKATAHNTTVKNFGITFKDAAYTATKAASVVNNAKTGITITYRPAPATTAITAVAVSNTAPKVGDVLSATLTPAAATATYIWKVAGVQKATTATYKVATGDATKTITVTVTGTGKYSGTKTSAATAAVVPEAMPAAAEAAKITATALNTITVGDTDSVLAKAQKLVGTGYTVTVKSSSDETKISNAGVALAAGTSNVVFTVANSTTATDTADTASLTLTVVAAQGFAVTDVASIDGVTIKVTGTGFTEETMSTLLTTLSLKNTATPTTVYAISAPRYISSTEITLTTEKIASTVTSVTWTWAPAGQTAVTKTFAGETVKPMVNSVSNVNGNQIVVQFSEKLDETNAKNLKNYTLRNTITAKQIILNRDDATSDSNNNASTIVLNPDGKTATITLSGQQIAVVGIEGMNTLDSVQYRLFFNPASQTVSADKIKDLADNYLDGNTYKDFAGVIGADTSAPEVLAASYNVDDDTLTLNFNETVKIIPADVDMTKITLNGKALSASDFNTPTMSSGAVTFTLSAVKATEVETVSTTAFTLAMAAGAFKDTAGNLSAANTAVTITSTKKIAPASATYDEATSKLAITFAADVKITSIVDFSKFSLKDGTTPKGTLAGARLLTTTNGKVLEFTLNQTQKRAFQGTGTTRPSAPKVDVAAGAVTDTLLPANANLAGIVNVTYTAETVKPTIVSAIYNADTKRLQVTFSEDIYTGSAASGTNSFADVITRTGITVYNGTTLLSAVNMNDSSTPGTHIVLGESVGIPVSADRTTIAASDLSKTLTWDMKGSGTNVANAVSAIEGATDRTLLKVSVAADAVKDANHNGIADFATSANRIQLQYSSTEGPSVATFVTNTKYGTITFDKPMDKASVETAGNVNVYLADNTAVKIAVSKVELKRNNKEAYVFYTGTPISGSNYTVEVTGAKDALNNPIKTTSDANKKTQACASPTVTPAIADPTGLAGVALSGGTTNLSVVDADGNGSLNAGDTFTMAFTDPVDFTANATAAQKLASVAINTSATVSAGNTSKGTTGAALAKSTTYSNELILTLGAGNAVALGSNYLDVIAASAIKSIASDTAAATNSANTYKLVAPAAFSTAPTITTAVYDDVNADGTVGAGDSLTVTFDQVMTAPVAAATFVTADLILSNSKTLSTTGSYAVSWASDKKSVVVTLGAGANILPNNTTVKAHTTLKNSWNVAASSTATAAVITPKDSKSPELVSAIWSKANGNSNPNLPQPGDIVTLKFDKAITLATGGTANLFDTGATKIFTSTFDNIFDSANTGTIIKSGTDSVVIKLGTNPNFVAGTTQIGIRSTGAYMNGGTDKIVDAFDNPAKTASDNTAKVTITKGDAAPSTTAMVSGYAAFAAALADTNITNIILDGSFNLNTSGAAVVIDRGVTIDGSGKTITAGDTDTEQISVTAAAAANAVVFKNLTFTAGTEVNPIVIHASATNVSFENCTFGGTDTAAYGADAALGSFTLNGTTNITGDTAFTMESSSKITNTGTIVVAAGKDLTVTGNTAGSMKGSGKILTSNGTGFVDVNGIKVTDTATSSSTITPTDGATVTVETGISSGTGAAVEIGSTQAMALTLKGTIGAVTVKSASTAIAANNLTVNVAANATVASMVLTNLTTTTGDVTINVEAGTTTVTSGINFGGFLTATGDVTLNVGVGANAGAFNFGTGTNTGANTLTINNSGTVGAITSGSKSANASTIAINASAANATFSTINLTSLTTTGPTTITAFATGISTFGAITYVATQSGANKVVLGSATVMGDIAGVKKLDVDVSKWATSTDSAFGIVTTPDSTTADDDVIIRVAATVTALKGGAIAYTASGETLLDAATGAGNVSLVTTLIANSAGGATVVAGVITFAPTTPNTSFLKATVGIPTQPAR